jgi:hypothetical protein
VFLEIIRNADRSFGQRDVGLRLLRRLLNTALDLAHFLEILIQSSAIGCRQFLLQTGDFIQNRIEKADRLLSPGFPLRIVAPIAEKALENNLRAVLHWKRHGGRLPRDGVPVCAAETRIARQR